MKRVRRIWCLLLALVMLAGMVPSFAVPTQAAEAVAISTIGSKGDLTGIPTSRGKLTYLSDIYGTAAKKYSYVVPSGSGPVRDFTLDKNFFGTRVYAFTAANDGSRFAIKKDDAGKDGTGVDANGYRTLDNGVTVHYSDIVLGRNTTIFDKGLSFQPSTNTASQHATVIFDISNLDADYFYAVAGMTGEGNKASYSNRKINFEVYGSTATEYSEGMSFEKLAYCNGIRAYLVGEFKIPITGYNYLKLVAVGVGSSTSSAESAWGNACVYQLPRTDAEVSVEWDGDSVNAANRPEIQVQLVQDGTDVDGKILTLNAGNNWSGEFANLYASSTYSFNVLTPDSADYFFSYAGGKVTASYRHTSQAAAINWIDDDNAAGKRPASVEVELLKGGVATGTKLTLNDGNSWTGSFDALARFTEKGQPAIVYSVAAVPVADAYYSYTYNTETGKIDATYEGQTIAVDVAWNDDFNPGTVRPTEVKVKLLSKVDGSEAPADDVNGVDPITLNDGNGWAGSFEKLPKRNAEDKDLVYSVALVETPALHRELTKDNLPNTITLQYDAALTTKSIEVKSVPAEWNHNGNEDPAKYPTKIVVGVLADGVELGKTVELNSDNNWTAQFEGLIEANRVSGELVPIVYTFTAAVYTGDEVSSYSAKLDGTTVKLTFIPKTDIVAAVTWAHGENTDPANQPTSLDVTLYRDNEAVETKTLNAENQWSHPWGALPLYDIDTEKAISYSLKVEDIDHYVPTINQSTGAITMTYDSFETVGITPVGSVTQQLPTTLGKIDFLSDLSDGYNNLKVEESMPAGGIYKFRTDFSGNATIKLGSGNTEFLDGISGLASTSTQAETYIIYKLTDLKADKFFAAAGITGGATDPVLSFEVFGSTDGATYKKLAVAKDITGTQVGVFDVNIEGYNYLKLAVRNTGTSNVGATFAWADACVYSTASSTPTPPSTPSTVSVPVAVAWVGDNSVTTNRPEKIQVQLMKGSDSTGKILELTAANSWAGTFADLDAGTYTVSVLTANTEHYKFSCVNNTVIAEYITPSTPSDPTDPPTTDPSTEPTTPPAVTIPGKYTASTDGTYAGITDAKQGSVKYLSQMEPTEYLNTSSATTKNYPYGGKTTEKITIGEKDTEFSYGLGVHPNGATKPGYTVYDLTGVDADRFYAAVGITNKNGKNGSSKGVQFKVYADYGDGSYKLLAESDKILKKESGEFHVDIDGVKLLKLEISATGGSHSSCGSAWANACVYKYEANSSTTEPPTTDPSTTPSDPTDPSTQPTEPPTIELPGKYTASTDGTYAGFQAEQDSVIYLSEKDATDSTKGKYITGYYNIHASNDSTKTKRYPALDGAFPTSDSTIKIGTGKTFTKGLGVLPSSARETNKNFILLDLSKTPNVDRFYAVAGMTGTGKDSSGNKYAVVFEVYGSDKVVTNENDASFKKLAVSTDIAKADSGEFDVDISGIKTLKLVTIPAADNNGGFNSGCQSVWANACVYKYSASGSATEPTEPPTTEPTEPELPGKFSASSGSYTGIKAKKDSVIYLSEAEADDAAKGKYISHAYIVPGSGSDTPRYPTLDYPFSKKATDFIRLGANNAEFDRGLGVLPSSKGGVESFILVDLTRIKNVDRFYAAVGLTGTGSDNTSLNKYGVVFEVYGSDKVVTDAKDASFKKLAASTDLFKGESGEFDVDISGLKTLKLVTRVADGNNKGYNSGCQSAWANACVYKYDANGANPLSVTTSLPGMYVPSSNGGYQWISHVKSGSLQYLSAMVPTKAANGANDSPTTNNYPYGGKVGQRIIIGAKNTGFTYGLGVHPKSGTASAYTIYDVSGLNADYFYAAVGITNDKGKAGNTEAEGVIFKVSADFNGNGKYKLLAESDTVAKKHSGEFLVNIAGAKSLKLEIFSANGDNASCGSAWANACVFKYDANGYTPNSYTVIGASNATTTKKTTTKTSPTDNTGLEHIDGFIPSEDGEYTGVGKEYLRTLNWLSDLTFKEAFNTTNSANPDGQPTTLDHPYNALTEMIILGEADRAFFKGLGVHPKDPTKPVNDSIESWTTYDVSDLNVDRFYAAVGITNEKGKEGASKGVIFKVYGNYGDGEFKLMSHSGCLTGRETGEFELDISGVKELKLAIVSASTTHASSASAWGNACVYNSANKYEGVGLPQILEPTAKPTEPVVEDVIPEATEPVEAPAEEAAPVSTGVIITVSVMGMAILVLLIMVIKKHIKLSKLAKF